MGFSYLFFILKVAHTNCHIIIVVCNSIVVRLDFNGMLKVLCDCELRIIHHRVEKSFLHSIFPRFLISLYAAKLHTSIMIKLDKILFKNKNGKNELFWFDCLRLDFDFTLLHFSNNFFILYSTICSFPRPLAFASVSILFIFIYLV